MYNGTREWALRPGSVDKLLPDPALMQLTLAIRRFRIAPRVPRRPAELGSDLVQLHHLRDLLDLEIAHRAHAFAETDQAEQEGATHAFNWIRHECHAATASVEKSLCVGQQMTAIRASVKAVEAGEIGFGHLALIASTTRALADSPTASRIDEHVLLEHAREQSVGRFRHECAHLRTEADPKQMLREHVELVDARALEMSTRDDGALFLKGFFDPVGGATVRTVLEPLARRGDAADDRSRAKRLADALVELASHALDTGTLPSRNGVRPHLQVTATLETLLSRPHSPAAEMEFAGPVPAETAQRLACDAGVRRILFDSKAAVVDVGRAARVPAAPTRAALIARDRGCAWPGCDRSAAWTSAHHVRHWAHNGPTNLSNLALLCYRHHWLVHEGGWELARDADGKVTTIPPVPRNPRLTRVHASDLPAA